MWYGSVGRALRKERGGRPDPQGYRQRRVHAGRLPEEAGHHLALLIAPGAVRQAGYVDVDDRGSLAPGVVGPHPHAALAERVPGGRQPRGDGEVLLAGLELHPRPVDVGLVRTLELVAHEEEEADSHDEDGGEEDDGRYDPGYSPGSAPHVNQPSCSGSQPKRILRDEGDPLKRDVLRHVGPLVPVRDYGGPSRGHASRSDV